MYEDVWHMQAVIRPEAFPEDVIKQDDPLLSSKKQKLDDELDDLPGLVSYLMAPILPRHLRAQLRFQFLRLVQAGNKRLLQAGLQCLMVAMANLCPVKNFLAKGLHQHRPLGLSLR